MKTEFDVVIVGAGINGLAAGCYLARSGLSVAVVEKRNEVAPFALTEDLFGAGVPVDTHAGVCFLPMSPVWGDLELDSFGLELISPEVPAGTLWRDGKNLIFYPVMEVDKTAEAIGKFSRKDQARFLDVAASFGPHVQEILDRAVFSAPSEEGEDFLWSLGQHVGLSPADIRTMNGIELLDLLYEDEHVKMAFLGVANIGVFGDPSEKGEGAVMTLLANTLSLMVPRGGMHTLPHALVRCLRHHGGALFLNAPVERIEWEGGRPRTVVLSDASPYAKKEIRAGQAVVCHVSPPIARGLLGDEDLQRADRSLWRKMRNWDMTGHCAFTSYFLFDGPLPWGSAAWNPDVHKCAFPLRAWDSWDHAKRSFQYAKNEELFAVAGDVGEMYNLHATDPTRKGPDGSCAFVYEVEYPINLRREGGLKAWEDRRLTDELHEKHLGDIEALAPGARKKLKKSSYFTPIDNWRRNPSAIFGHELGGDVSGGQWYLGRMPSRSAVPGLYFSQGIWPASLTHLGNGYVAATAVAEDLGVKKKQAWWRYKPMERFLEKLGGG